MAVRSFIRLPHTRSIMPIFPERTRDFLCESSEADPRSAPTSMEAPPCVPVCASRRGHHLCARTKREDPHGLPQGRAPTLLRTQRRHAELQHLVPWGQKGRNLCVTTVSRSAAVQHGSARMEVQKSE
ncbi:hypothetical protein AOLI_G00322880 [Acnodon oligacanthus]